MHKAVTKIEYYLEHMQKTFTSLREFKSWQNMLSNYHSMKGDLPQKDGSLPASVSKTKPHSSDKTWAKEEFSIGVRTFIKWQGNESNAFQSWWKTVVLSWNCGVLNAHIRNTLSSHLMNGEKDHERDSKQEKEGDKNEQKLDIIANEKQVEKVKLRIAFWKRSISSINSDKADKEKRGRPRMTNIRNETGSISQTLQTAKGEKVILPTAHKYESFMKWINSRNLPSVTQYQTDDLNSPVMIKQNEKKNKIKLSPKERSSFNNYIEKFCQIFRDNTNSKQCLPENRKEYNVTQFIF